MTMKHVKLFEQFLYENESNGPKTYIYYIHNSDEKKFEADVRDQDGKVIFELKSADFKNDGHMKGKDDITGLVQLLITKNKIKQGDVVVPASSAKSAAQEEFTAEINTN